MGKPERRNEGTGEMSNGLDWQFDLRSRLLSEKSLLEANRSTSPLLPGKWALQGPLTLKLDRVTWPILKIDIRHKAY